MPEVLELVAPFTDPNKARQAGLRSAEVARQKAQELENLRTLLVAKPIEPKPEPVPVQLEVQRQIDLANELVTHARAQLKAITDDCYGFCPECKRHGADAKEQSALLREIRGLMEHLCRLHNIAQAPTSKVGQPKQTRVQVAPCVPVAPQPVVVSETKPSE